MAILMCDGCQAVDMKKDYYRCRNCRTDWCRSCVVDDSIDRGDGFLGKLGNAIKAAAAPTFCGECPSCGGTLVQIH